MFNFCYQDTLVAMEALYSFTVVDPNRNVFEFYCELESSATPDWKTIFMMSRSNYTKMQEVFVSIVNIIQMC